MELAAEHELGRGFHLLDLELAPDDLELESFDFVLAGSADLELVLDDLEPGQFDCELVEQFDLELVLADFVLAGLADLELVPGDLELALTDFVLVLADLELALVDLAAELFDLELGQLVPGLPAEAGSEAGSVVRSSSVRQAECWLPAAGMRMMTRILVTPSG